MSNRAGTKDVSFSVGRDDSASRGRAWVQQRQMLTGHIYLWSILFQSMNVDYQDGITIAASSVGMLLGALLAFAFESELVLLWMVAGLVAGAGLSAYLFYVEERSLR